MDKLMNMVIQSMLQTPKQGLQVRVPVRTVPHTTNQWDTSHKKVSTVTPYVTLLDHYLFSTYNSITCVLRLMLSEHTHAYYEVRIRYGIQYAQHVACKLSVQRGLEGASREKQSPFLHTFAQIKACVNIDLGNSFTAWRSQRSDLLLEPPPLLRAVWRLTALR